MLINIHVNLVPSPCKNILIVLDLELASLIKEYRAKHKVYFMYLLIYLSFLFATKKSVISLARSAMKK